MRPIKEPAAVPELLRRHAFRVSNEAELQEAIADLLSRAGIPFEREVDLGSPGRIDFLVGTGFGLEVKVGVQSPGAVLRQLLGYARSPRIDCLALATTRRHLARQIPETIGGKPAEGVLVGRPI